MLELRVKKLIIKKCRTCKNYTSFFGACTLYVTETYLDEGEFDTRFVKAKDITPEECKYEAIPYNSKN